MTKREEIRRQRDIIRRKIKLWDQGPKKVTVGPQWEPFGDTAAEVRSLPSLCNRHQSVVLVRAPEATEFTIQRDAEAQGLIILATSDADDPHVKVIGQDRTYVLAPGEAASMDPMTPLKVIVRTGNVVLMLVWRPGLKQQVGDDGEPRLIWNEPNDQNPDIP
jgi:hypothetical protein